MTTAQQAAEKAQQTADAATEKYDKEIAKINEDVGKKLEAYRVVGVKNTQKIDETKAEVTKKLEEVKTAVDSVNEVKDKVPELERRVGAAQDNAAAAQEAAEKAQEKFDQEIQGLREEIDTAMGASKGNVMKEINALRNQTNKGLAKVTALAGLHPLTFDKNNKLSLSVASGSYKSEHALALGGFYQPNRDVLLSFGSSVGGNGNAYTVGASVRVGSHSKTAEKQHMSQVAELYAAIAKLQAQVEKQQKEIVQLQRAK